MGHHTKLDFAKETLTNQTRAERRRSKKEQEKQIAVMSRKIAVDERNVFTLTEQQLSDFLAIERRLAIKEVHKAWGESASKVFLAAMKIVLHDKYNFGEKRLSYIEQQIEQQLDCIIEGCVTVEEMEEAAIKLNAKAKYKGQ